MADNLALTSDYNVAGNKFSDVEAGNVRLLTPPNDVAAVYETYAFPGGVGLRRISSQLADTASQTAQDEKISEAKAAAIAAAPASVLTEINKVPDSRWTSALLDQLKVILDGIDETQMPITVAIYDGVAGTFTVNGTPITLQAEATPGATLSYLNSAEIQAATDVTKVPNSVGLKTELDRRQALMVLKSDKADAAALAAGTLNKWLDSKDYKTLDDKIKGLGGRMLRPFTDSFAALPATPTDANTTNWYVSILTKKDGTNKRGFYINEGSGWSFAGQFSAFILLLDAQIQSKTSTDQGVVTGKLLHDMRQALQGTAAHLTAKDEDARPWTAKILVEWLDGRVAPVPKADGDKPDAGRFNIYPAGASPDYTGATAGTYAKVVVGTTEQTVIESGGEYTSVTPQPVTQSGRLWNDDVSYVPVDSFYFTAFNSTDVSANGVTTVAGQTYIASYVACLLYTSPSPRD